MIESFGVDKVHVAKWAGMQRDVANRNIYTDSRFQASRVLFSVLPSVQQPFSGDGCPIESDVSLSS